MNDSTKNDLLDSQSQVLSYLSHELRTPLNAILGYSELILAAPHGPIEPAPYKEYVEAIKLGGEHMLSLVNDVLDYAKLNLGKMELYEQKIDLSYLFKTCIKLMAGTASQKDITLKSHIEENVPLFWGDERLLKQALLNLLSNALKYTQKQGKITLEATLKHNKIELCVEDTGIGMTEEEALKALEPFAQINTIENRSLKGTGLGLPLVKAFTELHDGQFVVSSKKGIGSKFTLVFPENRTLPA